MSCGSGQTPCTAGTSCGAGQAVLVVAVDVPSAKDAAPLLQSLRSLPVWMKVGLELFTAEGPNFIRGVQDLGFSVFLDLKFHDIPNTVQGAVRSAASLGVAMATIHLSGGEAMCRAAVLGREEMRAKGLAGPLLMGITVLTSDSGDAEQIRKIAVERALMAKNCGLDGVVCSGFEAAAIKQACGPEFLCLCPGIRFAQTAPGADDQSRVCAPGEAVMNGADFLVMGRPITRAEKPEDAARRALDEMAHACAART